MILMTPVLSNEAIAQDLSIYRWESRLVLLIVEDENNPLLEQQLSIFMKDTLGLSERKLTIISSTSSAAKREYPNTMEKFQHSGTLYQNYHRKGAFEFILIGLDGGEKLRRQKVMKLEELYRIIDSMPMRAAEMRRNNH